MKREDVKKYVDDIIKNKVCDGFVKDFSELDSLEKVELAMYCEKEYNIGIHEDEIEEDWSTDLFVEYVYNIIYDH
jgi:acyl carrier protein